MGFSRRRHRATGSIVFLLMLSSVSACLFIPAARAQSATFTSTVGGREATTFSFPSFDRSLLSLDGKNLTFSNNATVTQNALQITPDSSNNQTSFLANQSGRVFFPTPFTLWEASSAAGGKYVASFATVFKANLYRVSGSVLGPGEGLAFVVASRLDSEPPPGSHGGYLGLTNASTDGDAANGFAAVELDTVKQPYDPDDNHVGLDINGVKSSYASSLTPFGIQLAPNDTTSGDDGSHYVWVDYDGAARWVWVYMAKNATKPAAAVLNASLDLSAVLTDRIAYFGFAASTGARYQLNCVLMWNMTMEKLHDGGGGKKLSGWKLGVAAGAPCAAALALGLLAGGLYMRKKRKRVGDEPSSALNSGGIDLRSIPGVPREFDYRELRKGTNNFDEKTKLGQGGYGVVYRATVAGDGGRSMEVAVKQFTAANTKGQEDFLAELGIINRLRHRNLVKLLGWCHQNGVLLLVYDFMPNGSLDRHLFGGAGEAVLNWEQRYHVVAGVASALNYLHHEYDQMVIHRDIKPSNIMLDSTFNARLGDFGLARALESDKTSYTDIIGVPGTLGYIAPECFHTGRATRESDVFGFGAVVLEVVCGRRVSVSSGNPAGGGCSQLLEAVWERHGAGRLLDAVDPRLAGEFDEGDAERLLLLGLACSHPNPGERPRTQAILQVLARSAPPPDVPPAKPAFMWPALPVARAVEAGGEPAASCSGVTTATSTAMTSSTSYYASSSGYTQNYVVERDVFTV